MSNTRHIHELLKFYALSREEIALCCNAAIDDVDKALDPTRYTDLPLFRVMRIRAVIEQQLQLMGWDAAGIDIWKDFDKKDPLSAQPSRDADGI